MSRTVRSDAVPPAPVDLTGWLTGFTASFSSTQPYREPTPAEVTDAVAGLHRMLGGGDVTAVLGPLGFAFRSGLDSVSGRPFMLAFSEAPPGERAWAVLLMDLSTPMRLVIGCPHPVADTATEHLGLGVWQRVPGALLLVAGAHRKAGGGLADPRDHPQSLFHCLAASLLGYGLPHLQLHGFADASQPDVDVVLSPGATTMTLPITRVADSLAAHDLDVARVWETPVPDLDGTTNIQGRAAAQAGALFIHVEISASTRDLRREQVLDGLAGADVTGTGWPGPILAQAIPGRSPSAVVPASPLGTSPYGARADHWHPEPPTMPARLAWTEPPTVLDYAAAITIDHASARSFAVTATDALAVELSSVAPADGATVLLEVLAYGRAVPVTFSPPTGIVGELAQPFFVAAGKLGLFELRHSARAKRWILVGAHVER